MKLKILPLLGSLLCLSATAQDQHVIDSITPLIRNDGSRRDMEIFHELGFQYVGIDNHRSLEYLAKSNEIAHTLGDSLKIVKLHRLKGQVLRRLGRQDEATINFEKALPIALRNNFSSEAGTILTGLAVTKTFMGQYDRALEFNFRALEIRRKEKDAPLIAAVLTNIGLVHYKVGNYDKAIEYYHKSLAVSEPLKLTTAMELNYSNLGVVYAAKRELVTSKHWILKSFEVCKDDCQYEVEVRGEYALGYEAWYSGKLEMAGNHFRRSYEIAVRNEDLRFQTENLLMLAKIESRQGNLRTAENTFINSINLGKKGNYLALVADGYFGLYEVYKRMHKSNKASIFLERYVELQDSINSDAVRNKIMVAQTEFEDKENKLIISHNEILLAQQKVQIRLVIVICILVLMLAISLFVILMHKHRTNHLLDQRVIERTHELETNKAALERAYLEQAALIAKTSQSIKSAIASQKGLTSSLVDRVAPDELSEAKRIENELKKMEVDISNNYASDR